MANPASYTLPSLRETPGAVLIKVRAQPGASRSRIAGVHGDALKVAVQAPPEKGRANQAIAETLASFFGASKSRVKIQSGETSRDKWFRLEGFAVDEVRTILAGLPR